jgi:hypothetical protein
MFPHHAETVRRTTEHFAADSTVTGLLLTGSLAHGFYSETSDVDVMIVVADADHQARVRAGQTCFFSRDLCTYAAGYVDGKYTSSSFLEQVATRGSEPARYAFKDAGVLFTKDPELEGLVERATRYPLEQKESKIWRFQAQFEAWSWYCSEALKRQNMTLLRTAVAKLSLFGGRLILAHNELLYPYHKWFLRVLADAPDKPAGIVPLIESLAAEPTAERIDQFAAAIRGFGTWRISHATWPAQFMRDSEVNWLGQEPPIDDL